MGIRNRPYKAKNSLPALITESMIMLEANSLVINVQSFLLQ
jgi:hypothetical protein